MARHGTVLRSCSLSSHLPWARLSLPLLSRSECTLCTRRSTPLRPASRLASIEETCTFVPVCARCCSHPRPSAINTDTNARCNCDHCNRLCAFILQIGVPSTEHTGQRRHRTCNVLPCLATGRVMHRSSTATRPPPPPCRCVGCGTSCCRHQFYMQTTAPVHCTARPTWA